MKKLMIVTALMTALMGTSVAFAEKNISFDDFEKMQPMSEQDKQQKGAGLKQQLNRLKQIGYGAYDIGQAGGFAASCITHPEVCTKENTPQWKSPINQRFQRYLDRH